MRKYALNVSYENFNAHFSQGTFKSWGYKEMAVWLSELRETETCVIYYPYIYAGIGKQLFKKVQMHKTSDLFDIKSSISLYSYFACSQRLSPFTQSIITTLLTIKNLNSIFGWIRERVLEGNLFFKKKK